MIMKNNNETTAKFEAGKTYAMTHIGDSSLKTPVKVLKRTEKSVRIQVRGEKPRTCRIKCYGDSEYILPCGNYSMAPSCYASRQMEEFRPNGHRVTDDAPEII